MTTSDSCSSFLFVSYLTSFVSFFYTDSSVCLVAAPRFLFSLVLVVLWIVWPASTLPPQPAYFCSAEIGKPDFKLGVIESQKKTTLYVTDPLTALFKDGHQLNIRDIFADQLQYKVTYRKNKSTGKKVHISKTNLIELTDLDKGESYCFSVQAYIPSRGVNKQLGELSLPKCSSVDNPSIFEVYSVGVIAAAIFLILLLIGIIIAIAVVCCKWRKKALRKDKEGVPLWDV
ncbi:tissue factor-like isoform X2 [Paralichthys olivaceus]|uniref:tissue factor-like isoform X2 n=1 Tax=Paralichthys olivaceus TaxID=8255 RepID=UPI0037525C00